MILQTEQMIVLNQIRDDFKKYIIPQLSTPQRNVPNDISTSQGSSLTPPSPSPTLQNPHATTPRNIDPRGSEATQSVSQASVLTQPPSQSEILTQPTSQSGISTQTTDRALLDDCTSTQSVAQDGEASAISGENPESAYPSQSLASPMREEESVNLSKRVRFGDDEGDRYENNQVNFGFVGPNHGKVSFS